MSGLFDKRKKRKLYEQWVKKSGLPEENIPDELRQDHENTEEPDYENNGIPRRADKRRSFVIHLETRHLLIIGLVIVFLLILSTTLATVLIMQSC